jgi:hypothetical protein
MKTLKLKMNELTDPIILTHHEIKNIMGGSEEGDTKCTGSCYKIYWDHTAAGTCDLTLGEWVGNLWIPPICLCSNSGTGCPTV